LKNPKWIHWYPKLPSAWTNSAHSKCRLDHGLTITQMGILNPILATVSSSYLCEKTKTESYITKNPHTRTGEVMCLRISWNICGSLSLPQPLGNLNWVKQGVPHQRNRAKHWANVRLRKNQRLLIQKAAPLQLANTKEPRQTNKPSYLFNITKCQSAQSVKNASQASNWTYKLLFFDVERLISMVERSTSEECKVSVKLDLSSALLWCGALDFNGRALNQWQLQYKHQIGPWKRSFLMWMWSAWFYGWTLH
jgi:hypothetical protein